MRINKHFLAKQSPIKSDSISFANLTNRLTRQKRSAQKSNQLSNSRFHSSINKQLMQKSFDNIQNSSISVDNLNYKEKSSIYTQRRSKLQNFRNSIDSLQKTIQYSQTVLNQSSLNYSLNSQLQLKPKVRSDSFQIRFNSSSQKTNKSIKKDQSKSIKKDQNLSILNKQSSKPNHLNSNLMQIKGYRQSLLNQSIKRNSINQQLKKQLFVKIEDQQPKHEKQTPRVDPLTKQVSQTPKGLNSTLQRLLNLSFQSNQAVDKNVHSPSVYNGLSPKWFQSKDFKLLNKIRANNSKVNTPKRSNNTFNNDDTHTHHANTYNKVKDSQTTHYQPIGCLQEYVQPHFFQYDKELQNSYQADVKPRRKVYTIEEKNPNYEFEPSEQSLAYSIDSIRTKNIKAYRNQQSKPQQDDKIAEQKEKQFKKNKEQYKPYKNIIMPTFKKGYLTNFVQKKKMSSKTKWLPQNFKDFQKKVLQGKVSLKQPLLSHIQKGKYSPRIRIISQQVNKSIQNSIQKQTGSSIQKKTKYLSQVYKYPFVEKYLNQNDILLILDKLTKSKIPQQKWIMFIIDQVHKKMKENNMKLKKYQKKHTIQ